MEVRLYVIQGGFRDGHWNAFGGYAGAGNCLKDNALQQDMICPVGGAYSFLPEGYYFAEAQEAEENASDWSYRY